MSRNILSALRTSIPPGRSNTPLVSPFSSSPPALKRKQNRKSGGTPNEPADAAPSHKKKFKIQQPNKKDLPTLSKITYAAYAEALLAKNPQIKLQRGDIDAALRRWIGSSHINSTSTTRAFSTGRETSLSAERQIDLALEADRFWEERAG